MRFCDNPCPYSFISNAISYYRRGLRPWKRGRWSWGAAGVIPDHAQLGGSLPDGLYLALHFTFHYTWLSNGVNENVPRGYRRGFILNFELNLVDPISIFIFVWSFSFDQTGYGPTKNLFLFKYVKYNILLLSWIQANIRRNNVNICIYIDL